MNLLDSIEPHKRDILQKTNALMEGHFRLSSGLHSQYYFQGARLMQYPLHTAAIAAELAEPFRDKDIDVVISPAVGAIILGYEMARELSCRCVFAERVDSSMALRRGFELHDGERVLIAEDVTTTGGSVMEIRDLVIAAGADVVGFCAIVDRSGGTFSPPEPFIKWLTLEIETFPPEQCPLCKKDIPVVYPGSKKT